VIKEPGLTGDPVATRLRRAYGFEEIALVPGVVTIDPAEVELGTEIAGRHLEIPFIAAAMDAVSDVDFAVAMHLAGGFAFVNLEGLYTRYEDAAAIVEQVAGAESGPAAAHVLTAAYEAPVRDELITALITRIKARGGLAAVATTPGSAWHHAEVAAAA
jgi:IMP dehydrogenase